MTAILDQNGLKKVVTGNKPEKMEQSEWDELDEKALPAIQLCLTNNVLQENAEVKIDDKHQALLLLYSLPPSYKTFEETPIYGRDNLTFEDVKGSLLSKDKLDNELGSSTGPYEQASGLVARGRQQSKGLSENRSRSKSRSKDKSRHYCKKGHIVVESYRLKNK
ncbi:hypothetical protein CRG98_026867 [Punica granatum]|uniref:Retrovirus-related Pol polyprotein from transposon TNT 1-94 n=1 Tax=Punica granatum TaxID=22663 RepID=A0A2I0JAR9_PUNGR|nr:hypothetical protein CRG98_026867 [Punica granatum]